jgi:hypothetical protein
MVGISITALGGLVLAFCVGYLVRDCRGNVSASMGGEMTFGGLWMIGAVLLSLGVLLLTTLSLWWGAVTVPVLYVASFPLRAFIQRRVCVPLDQSPTGFQRFVRKTETKDRH